jgi:hypothetical protein
MTEELSEAQKVRLKAIKQREEYIAKRMPKEERVRVVPRNEDMRLFLKHPNGVGFPESGSVEWPLDGFTQRRIADGDVTVEGGNGGGHAPRAPRHAQ